MLKRISKEQLRVGMFVEAFEAPAVERHLSSRRFMLKCSKDVAILQQSPISGVCINLSKGLDVLHDGPRQNTFRYVYAKADELPDDEMQRAKITKNIKTASALLKSIFHEVSAGAGVTVDLVAPVIDELTESMTIDPAIFISMTRLKTKDQATFLHSLAVSALMIRFATHLRFDPAMVSLLGMGGLLHDIGKIGMKAEILTKTGPLTDDEIRHIRRHPLLGYNMLLRSGGLPEIVLDVCLHHHEKLDGTGYPLGIANDQISLYARMAAICDVYDALTSVRPYKKSWSSQEATSWMLDTQGVFDPTLLHQFVVHVI